MQLSITPQRKVCNFADIALYTFDSSFTVVYAAEGKWSATETHLTTVVDGETNKYPAKLIEENGTAVLILTDEGQDIRFYQCQ